MKASDHLSVWARRAITVCVATFLSLFLLVCVYLVGFSLMGLSGAWTTRPTVDAGAIVGTPIGLITLGGDADLCVPEPAPYNVVHDTRRGVTCWTSFGNLSCLPDRWLAEGGAP